MLLCKVVGAHPHPVFLNFISGHVVYHRACDAALADLIDYVRQDGVRVAAFDATNSTLDRRRHIMQRLKDAGLGAKRMFVESICDHEGVSLFFCLIFAPLRHDVENQINLKAEILILFSFSLSFKW